MEMFKIELINNTNLSSNAKNEIKKLDKVIHAAVFTEGFCPDCIVTIPFIHKNSVKKILI